MPIKFRRPKSLAAVLSFKLVSFAIPFLLIGIVLHRIEYISGKVFFALLGVGFLLAILAIICGLIAYVSLWRVAAKGGVKATLSILIAFLLFSPIAFTIWQNYPIPRISDVSTDIKNRPEYVKIAKIRQAEEFQPPKWGKEQIEIHKASYPELRPRFYDISVEETAKAILAVSKARGWKLYNPPSFAREKELDDTTTSLLNNVQTASENDDEALDQPIEEGEELMIEGTWKSLVAGFKNDVAIRLIDENERTRVDIRSSARLGRLDFKANAKEIQNFLTLLDKQVLNFSHTNPE